MNAAALDAVHIVCVCAKPTFTILRTSVIWGASSAEQAAAQVPYTAKEEQWVYRVITGAPLICPEWTKNKTIPTPDTEEAQRQRAFIKAYDEWCATPTMSNFDKMAQAREALAALSRRPGIPNYIAPIAV